MSTILFLSLKDTSIRALNNTQVKVNDWEQQKLVTWLGIVKVCLQSQI